MAQISPSRLWPLAPGHRAGSTDAECLRVFSMKKFTTPAPKIACFFLSQQHSLLGIFDFPYFSYITIRFVFPEHVNIDTSESENFLDDLRAIDLLNYLDVWAGEAMELDPRRIHLRRAM